MIRSICQALVPVVLLAHNAAGFVVRNSSPTFVRQSSELKAFDPSISDTLVSAANNFWVATVDGDIDKIPNDQFGLVFAGGIAVMAGGVLSAMFVGFLLDKGDLYANLAAESYLQSADNEEFWQNLSDEEQVKARELVVKIKAAKEGGSDPPAGKQEVSSSTTKMASSTSSSSSPVAEPKAPSKPTDLFSDYGD